jgi:hypothetical protein
LHSLLIDNLLYLVVKGASTLSKEDGQMPKVGSTHYAYTAAGKKAAAAARKAGKPKPKPKRK